MEDVSLDSYITNQKKDGGNDGSNRNRQSNRKGGDNQNKRFNKNGQNNNNNRQRDNNRNNQNQSNHRGGQENGSRGRYHLPGGQRRENSDWNNNKYERRGGNQRSEDHNQEEKIDVGSFITIENLHYSVSEAELLEQVSKFGEVVSCKIFWDSNGRSEERAMVQFSNGEDAQNAIDELQGASIEDQELKVHFASNEDVSSLKKTKRISKQNNLRQQYYFQQQYKTRSFNYNHNRHNNKRNNNNN